MNSVFRIIKIGKPTLKKLLKTIINLIEIDNRRQESLAGVFKLLKFMKPCLTIKECIKEEEYRLLGHFLVAQLMCGWKHQKFFAELLPNNKAKTIIPIIKQKVVA